MTNVLDESYGDELKELIVKEDGSDFLKVNDQRWESELYKLERQSNNGCLLIAGVALLLVFIFKKASFIIYILAFLAGGIYKIVNAWRFKKLKPHGQYDYVLYPDKITRFSKSNYQTIEKEDIKKISIEKYGIKIEQEISSKKDSLDHKNKNLLIIPNKIECYDQILEYMKTFKD